MQAGRNTEVVSVGENGLILADTVKPKKGDRCLLVRAVELAGPSSAHGYQARPSIRCETFERRDTLGPDGRSFGPDKRIVVPSRSVEPRFKILLVPFRHGETLPETVLNQGALQVRWPDQKDEIQFRVGDDGRTRVSVGRDQMKEVVLP
jgi:hypothetical protein